MTDWRRTFGASGLHAARHGVLAEALTKVNGCNERAPILFSCGAEMHSFVNGAIEFETMPLLVYGQPGPVMQCALCCVQVFL